MNFNLQNIELTMSAGRPDQFPKDRQPQIALSGRSNVGKSSLINTVSGRKNYAHTSSTPGKTVTVNFYHIDNKFYIVDLPGYGFAKRSGERTEDFSRLTDTFLTKNDALKFVFQLVDLKVGPTQDDLMMIDWLNSSGIPYAVIATKSDKLNVTEKKNSIDALKSHPYLCPPIAPHDIEVVEFSALKGTGKSEVVKILSSVV